MNTAARDMVLAGLYRIDGWDRMTAATMDADPRHGELRLRFGLPTFKDRAKMGGNPDRAVFRLTPCPELAFYVGRLVIERPASRGYVRLAETLDAKVTEISRHPSLSPPCPDWRSFVVGTSELRKLPQDWAAALQQWRGVYLIVDESDGARYVGSAYGATNLLGRWRTHIAGNAGVTARLASRSTASFRFSILERVSPDTSPTDVIELERSWMERLDTIRHGLNT